MLVKIKATIIFETELPDKWEDGTVHFHVEDNNFGCANNAIYLIDQYCDKLEPQCLCLEDWAEFEVLKITRKQTKGGL